MNKINSALRIFMIILVFCVIPQVKAQQTTYTNEQQANEVGKLKEVLSMYLSEGKDAEAAKLYTKIGFIYWKSGELRYAADNLLEGARLFEALQQNKDAFTIYSNLGVIFTDLEEVEIALNYFERSLQIRRKTDDKAAIVSGIIDVAYLLQILNYHDDAIERLKEALALSIKINNTRLIYNCYQMLALSYKKIGNIKQHDLLSEKAESYRQFITDQTIKEEYTSEVIETEQKVARSNEEKRLAAQIYELQQQISKQEKDSLNTTLRSKEDSLELALQLEMQRQQEIKLLEQEKELNSIKIKEQKVQAQKQKLLIVMITGGLLLMIILVFLVQRASRQRKKANQQLEQHNKEIDIKNSQLSDAVDRIEKQNKSITQSINYAKNIQQALLPRPETLNEILKDAFIFFKPRDIVSGDFYWFKEVDFVDNNNVKHNKIIITAVDCTGHGVPGAFMSMIGFNLLDEIVSKGIFNPAEILTELNRGIHTSLKQKETNNKDGMDMAICVIDKQAKELEFAGAQNPLIYIQDGEVNQIKGDRIGIGGGNSDVEFTKHTLKLDKPTWCYIFSDGFIDQFGGDEGRKFMIKRFRQYLLSIYKNPMSEQKSLLKQTFKDWLHDKYIQIDDVLVMGFEV